MKSVMDRLDDLEKELNNDVETQKPEVRVSIQGSRNSTIMS
jgi:hypothetical protein